MFRRIRPRFRLRALMLLVLLCGAAMGAERYHRHRRACLDLAAHHAAEAGRAAGLSGRLAAQAAELRAEYERTRPMCGYAQHLIVNCEEASVVFGGEAAEHRRLERLYRRAAARPWESLPPGGFEGDDPS